MKPRAIIAGVGMTRFGNHADKNLKELALIAISQALEDAGVDFSSIEAVWAGTAAAPLMTGQVCINGQVVLQDSNKNHVPVINVENACATSSTALHQAARMVELGAYDTVLAFGVEKLYHPDREQIGKVFLGCTDITQLERLYDFVNNKFHPNQRHSVFMDIYAKVTKDYMKKTGATKKHFAQIVAKNSRNGSLNEYAQFHDVLTEEEVLQARTIVEPLTLPMCSPLGDGAAAAVIVSEKKAKQLGIKKPVIIRSAVLSSGTNIENTQDLTKLTAEKSYQDAGVGPEDLDVIELHDATAPAEIICYEALGLCRPGEGPKLVEDRTTELDGKIPVNVSGGLIRKGHPIGATGLGQIFELTKQLRMQAGPRQVEGAKVALAENGGGWLGRDAAAIAITILST